MAYCALVWVIEALNKLNDGGPEPHSATALSRCQYHKLMLSWSRHAIYSTTTLTRLQSFLAKWLEKGRFSLAAAALPYKGDSGARRHFQGEVSEDVDLWPCGVCKGDVLQLDVALYAVWLLALFLIVYLGLPACRACAMPSIWPGFQLEQRGAANKMAIWLVLEAIFQDYVSVAMGTVVARPLHIPAITARAPISQQGPEIDLSGGSGLYLQMSHDIVIEPKPIWCQAHSGPNQEQI